MVRKETEIDELHSKTRDNMEDKAEKTYILIVKLNEMRNNNKVLGSAVTILNSSEHFYLMVRFLVRF